MAKYDNWNKEDLAWKCRQLEKEIETLKTKNEEYYDRMEHYRFRIENELEPLKRSAARAYDNYVTDPSRHGGEE